MPQVGFEPTATEFERAKTLRVPDRAANAIDDDLCTLINKSGVVLLCNANEGTGMY
jgi:hypothetical protein